MTYRKLPRSPWTTEHQANALSVVRDAAGTRLAVCGEPSDLLQGEQTAEAIAALPKLYQAAIVALDALRRADSGSHAGFQLTEALTAVDGEPRDFFDYDQNAGGSS